MIEVNKKIAEEHGLTSEEYDKICSLLKKTPNLTELGIFSAMWNEHCSYKSSRFHLKKLNTKGKKVFTILAKGCAMDGIVHNKPYELDSPCVWLVSDRYRW